MTASVIIVTKDRKRELEVALASALRQSAQPEIIVVDDGSSDGTAEMVRVQFPSVRIERFAESEGYIVRRNHAAKIATGDVLFSIDDDAEFSTMNVIQQILGDFDDPRIGAVAVPYVEPRKDNRVRQSSPDASGAWVVDTFIGTAHAVRREVFLTLKGYREYLVHQGEESDYCLRMLEAGYVARLGRADPIFHYESPSRSSERMDFYGRRNDVLFAWQNVPMPYFPIHLIGTTMKGLNFALRCGRFSNHLRGIAAGYVDSIRHWKERRPVSPQIYRLHRSLKKHGPRLLPEIQERLPELETDAVQHS